MFWVIDYIISSWFHRKVYEEYYVFRASTMNFWIIFDAFLLPVKFVASALQNEIHWAFKMRIVLMSFQINREKRIVQTLDLRSRLTKQTHNLLTLDHSYWLKIVITWPSIDHDWANPQFRQYRLLRYCSDDRPTRFDQLAILSALYNDQHLSPYLNDALCKYWWPYVLTIHDLTSLPYMTLRPYHTSTYERPDDFTKLKNLF